MSHENQAPDLNKIFATFQPLPKAADTSPGNPLAQPARLNIAYPATAHGNTNACHYIRAAATARNLPHQFPAFRLLFSEQAQGFILIPEGSWSEAVPDLYQVTWDKTGRRFSIDLAPALARKHWATPAGCIRQAALTLHHNVQNAGTVLYVDLQTSVVVPKKKSKAAAQAAPAQQAD